ncbi:MAG: hypothetical protein Kow0025_18740 [Thermodesulfovibrionales bacterium]
MNETMKKAALVFVTALLGVMLLSADSYARKESSPYGTYQGGRRGSSEKGYGEKKPVVSSGEARRALERHFEGRGVRVGRMEEREYFFEAEIIGRDGEVVDRVIVDKRTGRIRSTY